MTISPHFSFYGGIKNISAISAKEKPCYQETEINKIYQCV